MNKQITVIKAYTSPYTEPAKFKTGQVLSIGKKDSEWSGWVWCSDESGLSRWVPESYVILSENSCTMKCDYEATELQVRIGDSLTATKKEADWYWCKHEDGRIGWVPCDNVKIISF
jgi:uncharacterized protein YgiM (DUF1202 family)